MSAYIRSAGVLLRTVDVRSVARRIGPVGDDRLQAGSAPEIRRGGAFFKQSRR